MMSDTGHIVSKCQVEGCAGQRCSLPLCCILINLEVGAEMYSSGVDHVDQ